MVRDRNTEALSGPLGIYAKTYSTHEIVDPLTGEITRFKLDPKTREYTEEIDPSRFRWERFAHKSVVNQLLPTSRTSKCMRWRVPKQSLQVLKSKEHNKAFYTGLQICASVWLARFALPRSVSVAVPNWWQLWPLLAPWTCRSIC